MALGIFGSLTKLRSAANDLPYTSQVALGLFGRCNAQASKVAHSHNLNKGQSLKNRKRRRRKKLKKEEEKRRMFFGAFFFCLPKFLNSLCSESQEEADGEEEAVGLRGGHGVLSEDPQRRGPSGQRGRSEARDRGAARGQA